MKRLLLAIALAGLALAASPPAEAHPLGNFSINHLTRVQISKDRIRLIYVLDQAEIPTFQERGLSGSEILARKTAEIRRALTLTVDGHRATLRIDPGHISHPPGQGGLPLTRIEVRASAPASGARRVILRDETFRGRVGWKAIVAKAGKDTALRSDAPSGDPTHGLRSYPAATLSSPLNERNATFSVKPGRGTLIAPDQSGGRRTTTNVAGDGFAGVFSDAAAGKGVLVLFLLTAFAWGAIHALSPGHGKTMVAAYLVGTRGTPLHAVVLGAVTTVTHTIGVFALGFVTLALAQFVLPEQLYPWLSLASGLLVLGIGGAALRSRLRWRRHQRQHDHGAERHPGESHHHGSDGHSHSHEHSHGHDHSHGGGHHHHPPEHITWRGLVGMGASAGLIPCPSALVVLLGAIAQHQILLGLVLILSFSLGLAATLTGLGLAVVWAQRVTTRLSFTGPIVTALPALSTALIIGLGLVLTLRAIPTIA